jgi:hypothetical protein
VVAAKAQREHRSHVCVSLFYFFGAAKRIIRAAQAPNHAELAAFDQLLAALGHLDRPIDDPRQELKFLLDITPAAKRLLGWEARDLLAPLWRQLADALDSQAFSIAEPNLHRSFAPVQAQDWPGARDAVRREPQWWLHVRPAHPDRRNDFLRH